LQGQRHKGCPYYTSRTAKESADIIFAPYNYILEPNIRSACGIDLEGAVVVFDEAHNIEDISRSAASLEVFNHCNCTTIPKTWTDMHHVFCLQITKSSLLMVSRQLKVPSSASTTHEAAYKALRSLVTSLAKYLDRVAKILDTMLSSDDPPQHMQQQADNNVWDGLEALSILENEIGLTKDSLAVYQRHYESIRLEEDELQRTTRREGKQDGISKIDITYDNEGDEGGSGEDDEESEGGEAGGTAARKGTKSALTSQSKIIISKMLTVFSFMFMNDCVHIDKYKMVIERVSASHRGGRVSGKTDIAFNLWCLSADVAFKDLGDSCHSIILTSGTLSPLDSFAGELGVTFPVRVEASHVIDTASQVHLFPNHIILPTVCSHKYYVIARSL
jgi:fanconi anemia group J protein